MRTGRIRPLAALLASLMTVAAWSAALPVPAAAAASVFRVTTNGDNPDAVLGDGICDVTKSPST